MAVPVWTRRLSVNCHKKIFPLSALDAFDIASVESALRSFLKQHPIKTSDFIAAVRSAVTGMANGPDVVQMLTCFGQDRVLGLLKSG